MRSRKVSTYSRINHAVPRCQSDELFKYAVDDNARADFTGRIHVAPRRGKTEAYQSNRSLVGSDSSKVFSKPQLEIYNDDVKCSHGCAIGQLDPMQMFYMRTRGLPEADARLLLRQAFMADVIDAVGIDSSATGSGSLWSVASREPTRHVRHVAAARISVRNNADILYSYEIR